MLASSCPGWICYAEKTHGDFVLPFISTTKSPQQIMGTLVKKLISQQVGLTADQVFHVTVMPCFDKKLEASREDFYDDVLSTRDVDSVITTSELLELIQEKCEGLEGGFAAMAPTALDEVERMFSNIDEAGVPYAGAPGGSGGACEYVFRHAVKCLFGGEELPEKLNYKSKRNKDLQEVSYEKDGKPVLTFAKAYGFRNIQNLVRKLKQGKPCGYHYVEVMACPGGCTNGGGQIAAVAPETPKQLAARVDETYHERGHRSPLENKVMKVVYTDWLAGADPTAARAEFHTQYHAREAFVNALTIKW